MTVGGWRVALMLGALVTLMVPGCATVSPPKSSTPGVADPQAWQARQAALADLQRWSLQGRAATGKILGWSGNLNWRQRGQTFHLRVSGPLGAGGFRADGTLDRVRVRTKHEDFVTNQPESVVARILGWRFPLTGLRYWIRGLPEPGNPAELAVDERGLLVGLKQSGWELGFPEYTEAGGYQLPRRINLHNGDNTVNLVIDRWFDLKQARVNTPAAPDGR